MKVRPYNKGDYEDIIEISKHIWNGEDYLPQLINYYLEDPHCEPYVLEEDGKVVSVVNVNYFTPNFVWLEAMRTHPDYRNKGIATKLNKYIFQESIKSGVKELWLSTSKDNKATAKMLSKAGFEEVILLKVWGFKDDNYDDKAVSENKGLIGPILANIEFIENHISQEIIELSSLWRNVTEISEIKQNLSPNFSFLVGEFMIFPVNSYFIDAWMKEYFIFINDKTKSLMTFKLGKERNSSYILGIYDSNPDIITSALYFGFKQVKQHIEDDESHPQNIDIKLFYPQEIQLPLLDSDWIFRIMKKKLE